jgi:hypothetical protein
VLSLLKRSKDGVECGIVEKNSIFILTILNIVMILAYLGNKSDFKTGHKMQRKEC